MSADIASPTLVRAFHDYFESPEKGIKRFSADSEMPIFPVSIEVPPGTEAETVGQLLIDLFAEQFDGYFIAVMFNIHAGFIKLTPKNPAVSPTEISIGYKIEDDHAIFEFLIREDISVRDALKQTGKSETPTMPPFQKLENDRFDVRIGSCIDTKQVISCLEQYFHFWFIGKLMSDDYETVQMQFIAKEFYCNLTGIYGVAITATIKPGRQSLMVDMEVIPASN